VQAVEGVPLTLYEGCGHFPHLERPAPLARDLMAFLTEPHPEIPRAHLVAPQRAPV
jgi:hypothetical protein